MNKSLLRKILLLILLAGVAVVILYRDQLDAAVLQGWINDAGILGPLVFILIYIIGTVLFFPGSVLTLAGGALFGPIYGTFYNLTGAAIGAGISFLIARYLLSDYVEQKAGGRVKQLKEGVEREGWRFVAFVRLVPLFPFNLLNYALGLTRIKFSHYFIASYICMFPGGLAYTYFGYIGKEAATGGEDLIQKGLLALALVAVIIFIPRLISSVRQGPMLDVDILKQKLDNNEDILVLDVSTAEDFSGKQGHITNAKNIPLEGLAARFDELLELVNKSDKPVAIISASDSRSVKAAHILEKNGFSDVHVVKHGITGWNKKGYPTV